MYQGPGWVPAFMDCRLQCSHLNLVKSELLEKTHLPFWQMFAATCQGRFASGGMNAMLGQELKELLEAAQHDFMVEESEMERAIAVHARNPADWQCRPCKYQKRRDGCKAGANCNMLHIYQA